MTRSKLLKRATAGVAAFAVPLGMAIAGPAPASADPNVCVSGPYGYAYACVDAPGWVNWNPPKHWKGPKKHWRGHGHWHD